MGNIGLRGLPRSFPEIDSGRALQQPPETALTPLTALLLFLLHHHHHHHVDLQQQPSSKAKGFNSGLQPVNTSQ